MPRVPALGLLAVSASVAGAIIPTEIDEAAAHAHNGLRSVVSKLAAKKLAGRDDTTPGSLAARTYLIPRLRRLGAGRNGSGKDDAAYERPFTSLGQAGTNLLAVMPVNTLRRVACQKFRVRA
jgi:hypothetical protein